MPIEPRFSLLTFPQRFDGTSLELNILLVPRLSSQWNADPLQPLVGVPNPGDTAVAFADADLRFEVRALDGTARFPVDAPIDLVKDLPAASGVVPDARALFEALTAPGSGRFTISSLPPRLAPEADDKIFIRKYLPLSYRDSFLFTGPRTHRAATDDSYRCAIKE